MSLTGSTCDDSEIVLTELHSHSGSPQDCIEPHVAYCKRTVIDDVGRVFLEFDIRVCQYHSIQGRIVSAPDWFHSKKKHQPLPNHCIMTPLRTNLMIMLSKSSSAPRFKSLANAGGIFNLTLLVTWMNGESSIAFPFPFSRDDDDLGDMLMYGLEYDLMIRPYSQVTSPPFTPLITRSLQLLIFCQARECAFSWICLLCDK